MAMSKLSRKAKVKQSIEADKGKKVLLYLTIGLIILAVIIGLVMS
jgi:hypothetical protein